MYCLFTDYTDPASAAEKSKLEKTLKSVYSNVEEVPIVIGDEVFTTKDVKYQVMVIKR